MMKVVIIWECGNNCVTTTANENLEEGDYKR